MDYTKIDLIQVDQDLETQVMTGTVVTIGLDEDSNVFITYIVEDNTVTTTYTYKATDPNIYLLFKNDPNHKESYPIEHAFQFIKTHSTNIKDITVVVDDTTESGNILIKFTDNYYGEYVSTIVEYICESLSKC